jgi:hypothetical protein
MRPERVAEALRCDLEPFRSSDPVLDPDAEATQSTIILLLLIVEFPVLWFLVWKFQVPVLLVIALVRAIGVKPCLVRQFRSITTDRQVMTTAGVGWRGADDATFPGDDVFGFQRVALLLPGVMLSLFRVRGRTLDGLLGAIDDQSLGFLPADVGLSLNTDQRPNELLDPLDRPADRALVDVVKEAQEFLGNVATIIDQHDQEMIFQTADIPGAAGFGLTQLNLLPGDHELLQHAVERGHTDPGQPDEARAGAQPGGGKRTGHRAGTFTRKVLDESKRPVTCQAGGRWLGSAKESREPAHFRNRSIEFRRALFEEALQALLDGEPEEAKSLFRACINATMGFEELSQACGLPIKSLMRMVGPRGNPTLKNISVIVQIIQNGAGIKAEANVVCRVSEAEPAVIAGASGKAYFDIEAQVAGR